MKAYCAQNDDERLVAEASKIDFGLGLPKGGWEEFHEKTRRLDLRACGLYDIRSYRSSSTNDRG